MGYSAEADGEWRGIDGLSCSAGVGDFSRAASLVPCLFWS